MPKYQKIRPGLKPLNVLQPEGASFTVIEDFPGIHLIEWQKWRFRLAFNAREGMVLYDVSVSTLLQAGCFADTVSRSDMTAGPCSTE